MSFGYAKIAPFCDFFYLDRSSFTARFKWEPGDDTILQCYIWSAKTANRESLILFELDDGAF